MTIRHLAIIVIGSTLLSRTGKHGVERPGGIVPARTPADVIAALNTALRSALAVDTVKAGLARLGFEPAGTLSQEFAQIITADTQRWADVVKSTGFKTIE